MYVGRFPVFQLTEAPDLPVERFSDQASQTMPLPLEPGDGPSVDIPLRLLRSDRSWSTRVRAGSDWACAAGRVVSLVVRLQEHLRPASCDHRWCRVRTTIARPGEAPMPPDTDRLRSQVACHRPRRVPTPGGVRNHADSGQLHPSGTPQRLSFYPVGAAPSQASPWLAGDRQPVPSRSLRTARHRQGHCTAGTGRHRAGISGCWQECRQVLRTLSWPWIVMDARRQRHRVTTVATSVRHTNNSCGVAHVDMKSAAPALHAR